MTQPTLPPPPRTRFTVSDFNRMGGSVGFNYRFPGQEGEDADIGNLCIAEGRVEECEIRPGITLIVSDVHVYHHYESTSVMTPRFSAIVMLQGQARARLDKQDDVRLAAQSGLNALYGDTVAMTGVHPAGQRLRSVNLSVTAPEAAGGEYTSEIIWKLMRSSAPRLRRWPVPHHLLLSIEHLLEYDWDQPLRNMVREGVGTQLLAHALAAQQHAPVTDRGLTQRDRQLLERVRERLHEAPGEDHTLDDLARLACMSPSTLRAKFHAVYHRSVFSWLRERRLEVARQQLARGWSVQQAAHFVGYRHATNFATAFRERYGVAPSQLG